MDRKALPTHVTTFESTPLNGHPYENREGDQGLPWRTGVWRRFPLLGVCALLGNLLCIGLAIFVLESSNGQATATWGDGFQPSIYLAILNVAGNLLLAFSLAQGLTISFWQKALNGGTLSELQYYWNAGDSVWGAIRGSFKWRAKINAFACIAVSLSVIRGPLNQQATSVVLNTQMQMQSSVSIPIAQQLPSNYTGITPFDRGFGTATGSLTVPFANVMKQYSTRQGISMPRSSCGDPCVFTIKGFGFVPNCTFSSGNFSMMPSKANAGNSDNPAFTTSASIFPFGNPKPLGSSQNPYFAGLQLQALYVDNFTTSYSVTRPKNDTLRAGSNDTYYTSTIHTCVLSGGVILYPVRISNLEITLRGSYHDDVFVSPIDLRGPTNNFDHPNTVVGGFQYAADYLFKSSAYYHQGGATPSSWEFNGSMANQYTKRGETGGSWTGGWSDPMDDMINSMREIAFRAAIQAATDNSSLPDSNQTSLAAGTLLYNTYTTDRGYMIAGAVVGIFGALSVLPLYRGWSQFGRKFSMSPLEIAKAFDAPLLREVDCNSSSKRLLQQLPGWRIKYGEVHQAADEKVRLAFGDMRTVLPPMERRIY
ncbi:hypothetical protein BGZ60DRAFT_142053 [Tricladium varicosporioides]|nr:hypothetical protein BGZ60DRAFT_142053 [Hymenoscyphus varicosporioides]